MSQTEPLDRSYSYYWSSYLTLNIIVTLKCELEVTQVIESGKKSLGTVSYSPSIVTMAVTLATSEILSLKEWPDLEIGVWDRSMSLKMARFDRP